MSPTLVLVEKEKLEPSAILVEILTEAGIKKREISQLEIEEKFDKWYEGECNKKSVSAAIEEFLSVHSMSLSKEI